MKDPTDRREERRGPESRGTIGYVAREAVELALLVLLLLVIRAWLAVPTWLLIGLPLGKLLASALVYVAFVRRTLRRPAAAGAEILIGRTARTTTPLRPKGMVRIEGEIWTARTADGTNIKEDRAVEIVDIRGNTVLVARPAIDAETRAWSNGHRPG